MKENMPNLKEWVVSKTNRHGKLKVPNPVHANRKAWSFNLQMDEYNVVTETEGIQNIGAPRNFALMDYHGNYRNVPIQLKPTEKDVQAGNVLSESPYLWFEYFIHPNKAFSFFSSQNIALNILSQRIEDEGKFYRMIEKQLRKEGIMFPKRESPMSKQKFKRVAPLKIDKTKPITVENLETYVNAPIKGSYPVLGIDGNREITEYGSIPKSAAAQEHVLLYSYLRQKALSHVYGPKITALKRANDYAFFKNPVHPSWEIPDEIKDFRFNPHGKKWSAFKLNDRVIFAYRKYNSKVYGVLN
jgi:hypothetical protein